MGLVGCDVAEHNAKPVFRAMQSGSFRLPAEGPSSCVAKRRGQRKTAPHDACRSSGSCSGVVQIRASMCSPSPALGTHRGALAQAVESGTRKSRCEQGFPCFEWLSPANNGRPQPKWSCPATDVSSDTDEAFAPRRVAPGGMCRPPQRPAPWVWLQPVERAGRVPRGLFDMRVDHRRL